MRVTQAPFEAAHFLRMPLRHEDEADLAGLNFTDLCDSWAAGTTVLLDDEPAFFYGTDLDEGVGMIWAVTSPQTDLLPLFITRLARARIQGLFNAGAHRVEAYCHKDNRRSLRWLTESLGFTIEGLMRKSGPNAQDRYLMSLLPGEATYICE